MTHPDLDDLRLAAKLFGAGLLVLLCGAALGLNPWPGQDLVKALVSGSGKEMFLSTHGQAINLAVLFWASRPSQRQQWFVLAATVAIALGAWLGLGDQLQLGWSDPTLFPVPMFLAISMGLAGTAAMVWRFARLRTDAPDPGFENRFRWLLMLVVLLSMVPVPALMLTASLHPHTFDAFALHWDRVAGLGFTPWLVVWVDEIPAARQILQMAYGFTPLAFFAVALLHARSRPQHVASAVLVWVGMTSCALVAYHFFPVAGPKYLFGSEFFVNQLRHADQLPVGLGAVPAYPRNAMPSMHFGWMLAASILWWRSGTQARSRAMMITTTVLVAIATLFTGEHYVVDLIVAVPFVLGSIALCSTGVAWTGSGRLGVAVAGFGAWLAWVLLLRHQLERFLDHPWLCWVAVAATAAVVWWQSRRMAGFAAWPAPQPAEPALDDQARDLQRRFGLMFFASGAAALVYQVVFAKELALVFGSTSTATLTVLATFLGGMAIGSLIGGLIAHRVRMPLVAYAFVEMAIALYCVLTPQLFKGIQAAYVALASGMPPDAPVLLALRVALGATVLLVPTVLMGTTLPLLAQALGPRGGRLGSRVAWLYFANTAGAAVGALLTAYFVIPAVGVQRTTLLAALLNLLVALGAMELFKKFNPAGTEAAATPADQAAAPAALPAAQARGTLVAALVALGLGGVLSLGLEVVYVHMLSIVAGNSVYSFGLMVATFLVGLSLGGEGARRVLLHPRSDAGFALALSLLGLSMSVAIGAIMWNSIPEYFASYATYSAARDFGSREAIRGLVCAVVMVPPTLFIGAAYVFAMELVTASGDATRTVRLGVGAAINTLGNIAGVLLFGFVLLPWLGGLVTSRVIAIAAMSLAVLVLLLAARRYLLKGAAVAAVPLAVLLAAGTVPLNYDILSSGANVYFAPQGRGTTVEAAESIDGGLTTVVRNQTSTGATVHTLLTNGKFQGNDAMGGEMQAQIGFAFAPLLHQDRRGKALVLGYGTGVTSRVFHEAGFEEVEIAELSRDVIKLADGHFSNVNASVSSKPGVKMQVTDGRNLLLLTPKKYDVISIEISSIWFAGAASLYNREFYALARERMTEDGVLQQWMQLHRLSPMDLLQIIATLRSEFRHVSVYAIGGQGILVATNKAERADPSPTAIRMLQETPTLAEIRTIAHRDPATLVEDRLLDSAGVDHYVASTVVIPSAWASTDDNLSLEYNTPKANVNDPTRSSIINLEILKDYRRAPPQ